MQSNASRVKQLLLLATPEEQAGIVKGLERALEEEHAKPATMQHYLANDKFNQWMHNSLLQALLRLYGVCK